jgi:hypothetical protein
MNPFSKKNLPRTRHGLALLLSSVLISGAQAATFDLSDCAVLSGKQSASAYKKWKTDNQRRADAGEQDAVRHRAAVAMNWLACLQEAESGDEGWTIVEQGGDADKGGVSKTTGPAGIPEIAKKPASLKALKEALRYSHQAGAFDPGYRGMSAQLAARYATALPESVEDAYADAAGAYEFDCVLKRPYDKRDSKFACAMIRPAKAQLSLKVAPARRAQLDATAKAWAQGIPAN